MALTVNNKKTIKHKKPRKKIKKYNKYFVGDIESNNPKNLEEYHQWKAQGKKNFVVGGLLSWKHGKKEPSYVFFVNQRQMWNYLKRIARQPSTKKVFVWFHNLKYDFNFFIQQIIEECDFDNEKRHKMKSNTFNIFYQSGMKNRRVLFINVQYEKSARIQLRCSLQLFPNMSLGDLGLILEKSKKYNFELLKGKIDYQKQRHFLTVAEAWKKDAPFMNYLKQDLLILYTVLNDAEFQTIFNGNIHAYTMPSAVFKDMNEQCPDAFLKDFKRKTLQDQDFNTGITGYLGGLTLRRLGHEFNGRQKIYENVYYSDIVSSYPFQMWKGLPTERSYKISEMGWENSCFKKTKPNHFTCAHLLVIEIEFGSLKKNMPTGIWHQKWRNDNHEIVEQKYFYHEMVFEKPRTITIWEEEWGLLQKVYDFKKWNVVMSYHFLIEKIASVANYIDNLFQQKQTKKNSPALYYAIKAKINSTYGQLGMNDEVTYKVLKNIKEIKKITKSTVLYQKNGEFFAWEDEKKCDPKIRKDVFKAGWITSKARIRIIKMLLANQKNWLYSDTDCIFSESEINFPNGEKIGNQLGDWSKPEIIKYLKILDRKKYAIYNQNTNEIECKSAGIAGVTINHWLNDFLKKGHHPKCVLNNFNELNLKRTENKKSFQTRYGACLIDGSFEEKPIFDCTCKKINQVLWNYRYHCQNFDRFLPFEKKLLVEYCTQNPRSRLLEKFDCKTPNQFLLPVKTLVD